jgi:hypothetical protein
VITRLFLTAWLGLGTVLTGGEIPAPPGASGALFKEWAQLRDTESARAMISGTAPVEWGEAGFVRLPVRFKGKQLERASWDIEVDADLRIAKGLQFDLYCGDLSPFSYFSLYCHHRKTPGFAGETLEV